MDKVVVKFCRYVQKALSYLHRGSSFPGKLALDYNKRILKELSGQYRVILITGTNGKTTTAGLIAKILRDAGRSVIHNSTGANMLSGVMTLFIQHENDRVKDIAVVEIDEASLPLYTQIAGAEYIVATNIFKDQLDRYGEIYTTSNQLKNGFKDIPGLKMVLNGDEPLFGNVEGKAVYFGFAEKPAFAAGEVKSNVEGQFCILCRDKYLYDYRTYNHLGRYFCRKCGYRRPHLDYYVKDINMGGDSSLSFKINDRISVKAGLGGVYNIYNILAAFAVTRELGISDEIIVRSIATYEPRFGRAESFIYKGKKIKIILVKNPVSFSQGLRIASLNPGDKCGCFILNDNAADGRDVSWIWDVDFENNLTDYKNIYVAGCRGPDMALRLKIAGYDSRKIEIFDSFKALLKRIKTYDRCSNIYIFATYTAMLELRRLLAKQKLVKHAW